MRPYRSPSYARIRGNQINSVVLDGFADSKTDAALCGVFALFVIWASVKLGDTLGMLIWLETINGILCCFGGYTDK